MVAGHGLVPGRSESVLLLVLMMDTAYILPTNDLKSPSSLPCSCMQCFHSVHLLSIEGRRGHDGVCSYSVTVKIVGD